MQSMNNSRNDRKGELNYNDSIWIVGESIFKLVDR